MVKKYLVIIFSIVLLTGCFPSKRILEDIQLVSAVGYDYHSKNKVKLNAMVAIPQSGEDVPPISQVFTTITHTSKMARALEQAESPKPFQVGRLEVALYDNRLAEKGIYNLVDTLQRDPALGRDLYLAVVQGSTKPLLDQKYPLSETPSKYLFQLLQQNMLSNIPDSNLHRFLYTFYGKGMDPNLPLLEKQGDRIRLKGTAILKDDKMVGQLNLEDSFMLKLMMESFEKGIYEVKFTKDRFFTIQNISSKAEYHFKNVRNSPAIDIVVKIKGRISEAPKIPVSKPPLVEQLERATEKEMSEKINKMVDKLQKWNVDPIGLGDLARSRRRGFNFEQWEKQYPDIPINVKVKVEIVQAGITE
ncbi:Ger(x)C family spore germination protein [Fictibacillus sp. b24]|uniref:Ger(x)C family spore germination protein n=1 Tax=Fictibacillus sp. b24 TaxID=3055863 RepID=UPI0025A2253B|nr:Ger(x)C family spore germination protein [Fictibacillus sp. b24]MDM5317143.1 Ger(x)C family spore germination protein [Fictibacillus sp. b24]